MVEMIKFLPVGYARLRIKVHSNSLQGMIHIRGGSRGHGAIFNFGILIKFELHTSHRSEIFGWLLKLAKNSLKPMK